MRPTEIILHCAATPEGREVTAADIDRMHKTRGWKGIGYHYFIRLDGTVEKGRRENEVGAHTTGHNAKAIGICYAGGMDKDMKKCKDTRTEAQKEAMTELVRDLMKRYNIPRDRVYGHYHFSNKCCPSFDVEEYRKEL